MFPALSSRVLIALAAAGSAALLGGALIFQALGYPPCELCVLQRWPHLAAALLGAVLVALRLPQIFASLGAVIMALSTGLGIYHSGVERHIFEGPDACTSNPLEGASAADLLAQINAAPLVRCDEIAWQLMGVTMPNLNALISLALVLLWIAAARAKAQR
ncbi:disulfide bond formation protein B [Rhodobacter maris]|uniref:Disulfide bond formation protein DsbB n=1 Tax=Rhodobacter maris TaxID=446682 RepID=A0A285SK52_9RHOB|nr:disulfide bond formation protein B [Rhodobacter maris]SOC08241.1 disulfide bond formation protein DsbB [Rhodobacter maris]